MNVLHFSAAHAVFVPFSAPAENAVSQYGFYYALDLSDYTCDGEFFTEGLTLHRAVMRLTARNVYRLYINGEIIMHGPARTAHGYCRVDEVDVTEHLIDGVNHIAVEVMEYGNRCEGYNRYSNDSTMEDGLFIAEIDADGRILAATGRDPWRVCTIGARAARSERISHSRECTEIYTLDDDFYLWKLGLSTYSPVVAIESEPVYLAHEALQPTLRESFFTNFLDCGACRMDDRKSLEPFFFESNSPYYTSLPEHPTADCRRTVPDPAGIIRAEYGEDGIALAPLSGTDYYALWDGGESRVGFIRLAITCEKAGTLDLVRSEIMDTDGTLPHYFNNVTRLHVPAGLTEFVTMEPALARYVAVYFRGVGRVTAHSLSILDDAYPDEHRASFLCSDENVNRIYNAAKKTLLLNTLDIFMDCPERERGGWLCDSLWTARAAALLLSDNRVEREYLENFLLTPAEGMGHAFFPEVYPALKDCYQQFTGLTTWSFWLLAEVCEFIRRTGDIAFLEEHKPRIQAFVRGSRDFMGTCGLLENMPAIFIDWSQANNSENVQPISTAANALYAYVMTRLGETFSEPDWVSEGERVKALLRSAVVSVSGGNVATMKYIPDSLCFENGAFRSRGKFSEAAMYTSLWCGLFSPEEAPVLYRTVRDLMGPAPRYAKDPMVGSSQLFIGLCIRLDMLARMGAYDKLYEDLLAICEPQLREGPGTIWENCLIDTSSRCHGFTSHFGVHLMRDVLGLGFHLYEANGEGDCTLEISPHICGLRWAKGSHETPEGMISVSWAYDGESFTLRANVPSAYECRVTLPREVRMLDESRVSVTVTRY